MDLKEAVDRLKWADGVMHQEALHVVLDAARRELQRQEAGRLKRAPLEELERLARLPTMTSIHQTADVLKALREKVVPWLRAAIEYEVTAGSMSLRNSATDLLRALGEEP